MLLSRNDFVENDLSFANFFQHSFVAYLLDAQLGDLLMEFVACKYAKTDHISKPCRQDAGTSDVLIGFSRIDIHLNDNFETLFTLSLLADLFRSGKNL